MFEKISKIKKIAILVLVIQILLLAVAWFVFKMDILLPAVVLFIEAGLLFYFSESYSHTLQEQAMGVKQVLGENAEKVYIKGGIGLIMYDDQYNITWMTELFKETYEHRMGQKILNWIPEADDLIAGRSDKAEVLLDNRLYEITRQDESRILMFKDITEEDHYKGLYEKEHVVLGMASFDNYDESTQYADEADASAINTAVRTPVNEYFSYFGILAKRINQANYMLVLNEDILLQLVDDKFSILNKVRKAAQNMDVSITLSMVFARGSDNYTELDGLVASLMDLVQSRGGDQVAMQSVGGEVKFYGGSSEATEKRSRVRVRVISSALRDLMMHSTNVIICGHKNADFDCIGSALCLAQMAKALHKPVSIIAKTGGIEEKLASAMKENKDILDEEVQFITESEALNQLQDNSLVIMTDHHNKGQSNGAKVLDIAKKVVVIDHHRRSSEMGVKPILVYIEAAASSTCELVTEMIPFVSKRTDLSEVDATFMLAGMTIDTQNWRVRTGARTYEAASSLRKMGANPQDANRYLKDTFQEFAMKSLALSNSERYSHGIIIAPVEEEGMTRSLMSQVADNLLNIQSVNAAFVIANTDNQTAISARSNGTINVQRIMESMGGGGHLSGAAVQREKQDIHALKAELIAAIEQYFKEEAVDESNT